MPQERRTASRVYLSMGGRPTWRSSGKVLCTWLVGFSLPSSSASRLRFLPGVTTARSGQLPRADRSESSPLQTCGPTILSLMTCFGGSSSSTNTTIPAGEWGNYTLDTTSPNVYIRMGDPTGRSVVFFKQRDHITRAVPGLAQQLTGSPYRGRIESGIEDRTRTGWITVRFVTEEEEPELSDGACGRATVGGDPGSIWIIRRVRGNKPCVEPSELSRSLCP